jgi:UDP-galactopyranose mutase
MDELANFRFAPPELAALERELLADADLVFTGGYSLYEQKRDSAPRGPRLPLERRYRAFREARGPER